jgi:hypothetical protein
VTKNQASSNLHNFVQIVFIPNHLNGHEPQFASSSSLAFMAWPLRTVAGTFLLCLEIHYTILFSRYKDNTKLLTKRWTFTAILTSDTNKKHILSDQILNSHITHTSCEREQKSSFCSVFKAKYVVSRVYSGIPRGAVSRSPDPRSLILLFQTIKSVLFILMNHVSFIWKSAVWSMARI